MRGRRSTALGPEGAMGMPRRPRSAPLHGPLNGQLNGPLNGLLKRLMAVAGLLSTVLAATAAGPSAFSMMSPQLQAMQRDGRHCIVPRHGMHHGFSLGQEPCAIYSLRGPVPAGTVWCH